MHIGYEQGIGFTITYEDGTQLIIPYIKHMNDVAIYSFSYTDDGKIAILLGELVPDIQDFHFDTPYNLIIVSDLNEHNAEDFIKSLIAAFSADFWGTPLYNLMKSREAIAFGTMFNDLDAEENGNTKYHFAHIVNFLPNGIVYVHNVVESVLTEYYLLPNSTTLIPHYGLSLMFKLDPNVFPACGCLPVDFDPTNNTVRIMRNNGIYLAGRYAFPELAVAV